ncbi:MAG TPA: 2-oxoglutarate dehydrogenase complex dihydrolipoyllysine-residue succinyltransferase [Verrucomicrobiae bacterium]|nr:2-oxoglutarate dehydrogenase complex dihydrolipoyllysine-residue succinyltransferase [Verrucomicrobiae bacterium]
MAIELKIPEVGESITEVQITEWLKSEGDEVEEDESVAVIDSEKTTFELPSPNNGRLTKILRSAGDMVKVGEVVAKIETRRESLEAAQAKTKPERKSALKSKPAVVEPKAEKRIKEPKPDPGKPTRKDVKEPIASGVPAEKSPPEPKPAPPSEPELPDTSTPVEDEAVPAKSSVNREEEVVPMTMLRRTVARRLVEAKQTMAMLTTFNEVDVSAMQTLRHRHGEAFERRYRVKLGLMSFFVKAAIDALKQFPKLNAEIREQDIIYRNYFDIGVAVATERGLVVPVLRDAERLSFAELEKAIGDFARRARTGELEPEDLDGGTFTITNGGVFGSLLSTPIINPPQTGILGMHTIQERPVVVDRQVMIRPMMYLALTYDHRLVDGREAVMFLRRVKEAVEEPTRMLVEI